MSDNKAKCKFCTVYQVGGVWTSICNNENSNFCGDECVEKVSTKSKDCEDKEVNYSAKVKE